MTPTFLTRLEDPAIRTVLVCGCGGGFDFLHGLILWPQLRGLGKRIVVGSCSWGDPETLGGDAEVVFAEGESVVKRVTARSTFDPSYAPEVHLAAFLDEVEPEAGPHQVYAYNAREFACPQLTSFFRQLVREHQIDALILVDGGSDSLMAGDEAGLGDPVEDAVSLASAASLRDVPVKILLSVGLGLDRHNGVSDAASMRAVAELTARGGFLGALALEPSHPGVVFYRDLAAFFTARDGVRSAVPGVVLSVLDGHFGADVVPAVLEKHARPGSLSLHPLMAILWAFDVDVVAARSLLCTWIESAPTPRDAHRAVRTGREALGERRREDEAWPTTRPWRLAFLYDPEDPG